MARVAVEGGRLSFDPLRAGLCRLNCRLVFADTKTWFFRQGSLHFDGGGIAYVAWRRAVKGAHDKLNKSIADLENTYKQSLVQLTNQERNRLLQYGKQILAPVFSQLQILAQRYKEQQAQLDTFADRSKGLEAEINAIKVGQ